MGLRADISDGNGAIFSEDVLKVEVHGPNEDYLTIIDVPGIFRTTTQGTTKEDMMLVRDLVKGYIKEDRTIILAVLPSNVDVATQEILELSEEYDKNGERTLGVLTKPDLVNEPSAQATVCDLIHGKRRPLTLGYFLVRNRSIATSSVAQEELDRMFRLQPWSDLPEDRVGIQALKKQLRILLFEITVREFPKLLRDVGIQIRECEKELDSLGPPRQNEREQRSFLSHIAGTFQDRARAALAADYNADLVFDQDDLRLITKVMNITDVFSADFQQRAHSRHFQTVRLPELSVEVEEPSDDEDEDDPADLMIEDLRLLLRIAKVDVVTEEEMAELGDIIVLPEQISMPRDGVASWISDIYLRSRGLNLGTFNANLVSVTFREQSRKWGSMTKMYMSRIIITLHRFIAASLRSVGLDEQSRTRLWSEILSSLVERYKMALAQANLLIEVEQRKQPYTFNQEFTKLLSKAQGNRITELLRPKARKDTKQYGETQYMVNLDDIPEAAENKSNVERLQQEIHDILHSYYNMALNRFIDNVFQLAVDHHLLHGPSSPLKIFSQEWVINLEPEVLDRIASEAKSTTRRRTKLTQKIKDLSKGLVILKHC
jgi:hypothetical protein